MSLEFSLDSERVRIIEEVRAKVASDPGYARERHPFDPQRRVNGHLMTCSCQRCRDKSLDGLRSWARNLYRQSRRNAIRRDIPFDLTGEQFKRLVAEADDRCMVSGIPFEHKFANGKRRPFAPSLDRIENSKGYTSKNCRLVCVIVNLSLNEWGLDCLLRMCRNISLREQELLAKEDRRKRYKPSEYLTIKEFAAIPDVELEGVRRTVLASAASRLCNRKGIQSIRIPIGDRKDGSALSNTVKAFPASILNEALQSLRVQQ